MFVLTFILILAYSNLTNTANNVKFQYLRELCHPYDKNPCPKNMICCKVIYTESFIRTYPDIDTKNFGVCYPKRLCLHIQESQRNFGRSSVEK
uniref:Uncharacterized protein n=1 Tax=Acrobeloides nanus TaxID=290746 RepID=A0A914C2J1_9BILA